MRIGRPFLRFRRGDVAMRILAQTPTAHAVSVVAGGAVLPLSRAIPEKDVFRAQVVLEQFDPQNLAKSATAQGYTSTIPAEYTDLAICGVCSGDLRDQQEEIILQRGMDWAPLVRSGCFNDDHIRDTRAALGIVTGVFEFGAGEVLPDGRSFGYPTTWIEGHLVRSARALDTYDTIRAFQGTSRPMGFSIQGKALERDPRDPRTVTKSVVLEMAITRCPVWAPAYAIAGNPATAPITAAAPTRSVTKSAGDDSRPAGTQPTDLRRSSSSHLSDEDREELDLEPRGRSKAPGSIVTGVSKGGPAMDEEEKKRKEEEEKKKKEREDAMDKSLAALAEVTKSLQGLMAASPIGRREQLLSKGANGGLSAEESVELARMLSPAPELANTINKSFAGPEIFDATPVIQEAFTAVVKSLGDVASFAEKSRTEQRNTEAVIAKALVSVGKLVQANCALTKSLSEKVELLGRSAPAPQGVYVAPVATVQTGAPAGAPSALPTAPQGDQRAETLSLMTQMLNKSRGEQEPVYDGLSLAESVIHFGTNGVMSPGTARAVSHFAQTGQIVRG